MLCIIFETYFSHLWNIWHQENEGLRLLLKQVSKDWKGTEFELLSLMSIKLFKIYKYIHLYDTAG